MSLLFAQKNPQTIHDRGQRLSVYTVHVHKSNQISWQQSTGICVFHRIPQSDPKVTSFEVKIYKDLLFNI